MSIESKFKRCDPDDPKRCHGRFTHGQCPYFALDGIKFCAMHQGGQAKSQLLKRQKMYLLTQWQARVGEFADHDEIKSLREEVGIARMLLENLVNTCTNSTELLANTPRIFDMLTRLEKLVSSCHRMEEKSGSLLDHHAALNIGSQIVEIVAVYVNDEAALNAIGDGIVKSILGAMKTPLNGMLEQLEAVR